MLEALFETFVESLYSLPFLFVAYLLIECLEHRCGTGLERFMLKARGFSVPAGAAAGIVPQCGFSVAGANLYAGGVITAGTLLAVYLSTSDEALLVLLAHPDAWGIVLRLVGVKLAAAVDAGYLFDFLTRKSAKAKNGGAQNDICRREHCGCGEEHGILKPALRHTANIYLFILILSLGINILIYYIGEDALARVLLHGSVLQPLIAALFGLIPSCAASVALAELYLAGGITFGAMAAGLCTSAGMGLVVLFRANRNTRANLAILAYLYCAGAAVGMVLQLLRVN